MPDPDSPLSEPIRYFGPVFDPADTARVEDEWVAQEEWLAAARRLVAVLFTKSEAELEAIAAKYPGALGVALEEAIQLQAWHERQAELARTVVARVQAVLGDGEAGPRDLTR